MESAHPQPIGNGHPLLKGNPRHPEEHRRRILDRGLPAGGVAAFAIPREHTVFAGSNGDASTHFGSTEDRDLGELRPLAVSTVTEGHAQPKIRTPGKDSNLRHFRKPLPNVVGRAFRGSRGSAGAPCDAATDATPLPRFMARSSRGACSRSCADPNLRGSEGCGSATKNAAAPAVRLPKLSASRARGRRSAGLARGAQRWNAVRMLRVLASPAWPR
jgi:hypothetical protein